ncbi:stage II sporulation protein P [Siminovitchia fordii]|uniref:Stage II sporulation protein P n=2 Tax=Siminovitchia fordii TaxID=254759 RepID=A0ABQ4K921_9BACI|nr:stage II sporulation protein P [Siminovitchia fordii]GIN21358.1 stage II sporulation protein P [Siminovitchia fordii]
MLKLAAKFFVTVTALFCLVSLIAFSSVKISLLSFIGNDPSRTDSFLYVMSLENQALKSVLPEGHKRSFGKDALELFTNINLRNMKSFLISEIPGLNAATPKIIVAGKGTDFTNLPIESPPPADFDVYEGGEEYSEEKPEEELQTRDHAVFIYSTHNTESFLPMLPGVKNPNLAWHKEKNVTLLGQRLGKKLEEKGIKTLVNNKDIQGILKKRGMGYEQSYTASREVVVEAMKQNKQVQYYIDIHRDSLRRAVTTTTVNGEKFAKCLFVVGEAHPNYEKNLEFATNLHHSIQKKYPGLSRGVFGKTKAGGNNGVYNQDLSENSLLIEIGGVDNTEEELNRTVDALADVISDYYWGESVEVNK